MEQENIAILLKQNLFRREKYLKLNQIEAYRLYDREHPQNPFAIDIYKDNAVIHLFAPVKAGFRQAIENALQQLLSIHSIFYKDRTNTREVHTSTASKASSKEKIEISFGSNQHKEIIINEYGHKFLINLSDYLDTGLFLDHRETRRWIAEQSEGKVVLNTFAYTGSFTIYAAAAGAQKTYSVDLSKTYCDWIKKNLELNELSLVKNWVYKMDTLEFFTYAKRKNIKFDIIIIDPPTFSRNKGKRFSVEKDHPLLINSALEVLSPNGFILFSNNKRDFKLQKEKLNVCRIKNIQKQTYPLDFADAQIHQLFVIEPL